MQRGHESSLGDSYMFKFTQGAEEASLKRWHWNWNRNISSVESGEQLSNERRCSYAKTARTDVSRGNVLGQTITTDTRTGNLLVALLAVLSTVGTRVSVHDSSYADEVQARLICGILSRS